MACRLRYVQWQKHVVRKCFEELRRRGVRAVGLRCLPCCTSCGHRDAAEDESSDYVGFTLQDRDFACDAKAGTRLQLYLYHGLTRAGRDVALQILKRHFAVHWDGTDERKILVAEKVDHWATLRRYVRARSVAHWWHLQTSHLYEPPHGRGFKRDLAEFLGEGGF